MRYKHQTVAISSIDRRDETYRITAEPQISDLMQSIGNLGLLNPPLLRENNARYTIICGFRRLAACRGLGWDRVEARILMPETTDLDCARFAVADNALQRPLNLIETSRSLNLLSGLMAPNDVLENELSALGLPANRSIIEKIKKICRLDRTIQTAVRNDTIALPTALELGSLAPDTGARFVELFENLKLSLNKQREILTLIREIARREGISIPEMLDEKDFLDILHHPDLDRNQKTRAIRSILKRRRFPNLAAAEKAFEQLAKELPLGHHIKLTPPKNFEGRHYTLSLTFKNLAELKVCRAAVDAIIRHPKIERILS